MGIVSRVCAISMVFCAMMFFSIEFMQVLVCLMVVVAGCEWRL
jgi:hypothetical protein